jgi:hypothetical protein
MLNEKIWDEFFIDDIAIIKAGKRLTKADMQIGTTPFIGSSDSNNGITNFISNTNSSADKNVLGVNYNGSVVENFYHPYKAIFSDDVKRLSLRKISGNKYHYLFIKSSILKQKNKYQYAYKFNEKRLKRQKIMLPSTSDKNVDWKFTEQYIKELLIKKLDTYLTYCKQELDKITFKKIEPLNGKNWGEFFIEDIAEITSGIDIYDAERIIGTVPYISSTAQRNGISHFVGNTNKTLEKNCISVNRNGSVGYSFYHSYQGLFSNDCRKLRPKYQSKFVGLFLANQITRQKDKYNYGYKMGTGRLKRQKIMLPINHNNQPDYEYMEQYMINLEFMKRNQYLAYLKTQQQHV